MIPMGEAQQKHPASSRSTTIWPQHFISRWKRVEMIQIYNKLARILYNLAYRIILLIWFFTRPTVYGVYVAVWYQQKLLIIKNSYRKRLTLPCGRIKRGEDTAQAAVRELKEEVGIDLRKRQLKFIGQYAAAQNHATDVGSFFEFEMEELPDVQVDNREVIWAQFMPLEQISTLDLNPTVKTWLDNR
jgi:8-oxo-dGTP pyrophosphatase MutT (NUDIX family)